MREVDDPFAYCSALPLRYRPVGFRNPHVGELYLALDGQIQIKGKSKSNRRPRLIVEHMEEFHYTGKRDAFLMIMGARASICGALLRAGAPDSVVSPW